VFIITNRAKLLLEVRVSTCYQKKGRKRKNFTATYLPTLPERFPGRYLSYTAPDDRLHLNKKDTLVRSDANSLSLSLSLSFTSLLMASVVSLAIFAGALVHVGCDSRREICAGA